MKKISTWVYILLSAVVYFGLIMLNTFSMNSLEIFAKLILTIFFAVMIVLHFAFLRSHYSELSNYTMIKKIALTVLSFTYLAAVNLVLQFKLTDPINMVILIHSCTLAFPMLLTMISVLVSEKLQRLSRIIYFIGIVELFAGGVAAIVSIYFPDLLIKSLQR